MVMDDFLRILFDGLGFGEKKPDAEVEDLESELSYHSIDSVGCNCDWAGNAAKENVYERMDCNLVYIYEFIKP